MYKSKYSYLFSMDLIWPSTTARCAELKDLKELDQKKGRDTVHLLLHNESSFLCLSLTSEPYFSVSMRRNPLGLGKRPLLSGAQSTDLLNNVSELTASILAVSFLWSPLLNSRALHGQTCRHSIIEVSCASLESTLVTR